MIVGEMIVCGVRMYKVRVCEVIVGKVILCGVRMYKVIVGEVKMCK